LENPLNSSPFIEIHKSGGAPLTVLASSSGETAGNWTFCVATVNLIVLFPFHRGQFAAQTHDCLKTRANRGDQSNALISSLTETNASGFFHPVGES